MYYQYLEYYWNNFNLERKENGSNDDREKALHEQQPVIFEGDQSSLLSNRYLISSRSSDSNASSSQANNSWPVSHGARGLRLRVIFALDSPLFLTRFPPIRSSL